MNPESPESSPGEPDIAFAHLGERPRPQTPCPECEARNRVVQEQYVFALGRIQVRFPTLGLEREFQRHALVRAESDAKKPPLEHLSSVLEENPHIGLRACYLMTVGGSPAYMLVPGGAYLRRALFTGVSLGDSQDAYVIVVGRLGPMAPPQACGGLLVPIVTCDQIYTLRIDEWLTSLATTLKKALHERDIETKQFSEVAEHLFARIAQSTENVGATDAHRALNYMLLHHPGVFLTAAQEHGRRNLDRIETRILQGPSGRRQVAIILSFIEPSTGVAERFFVRIDVSEEWPFVSDAAGDRGPLGLAPYVENALLGVPL